VVVCASCWIAVCLVVQAPNVWLWPGVVVTSAAGLSYLGAAALDRRQAGRGIGIPAQASTELAGDAAIERRLFTFVVTALGISGSLVGLRLGLWWLALPMIVLLMVGWAILVVQEVKRGWQKD
jgi:hypothetical protein